MQLTHRPCLSSVPSLIGISLQRVTQVNPLALFLAFRHCQGGRLEVPGGMPGLQSMTLLGCLWFCRYSILQHISCFVSYLAYVCHPQGGRVLAAGLIQGSTGPGPSQLSFSHVCGTSLQCSRQSVTLSPSALCPPRQDLSLTIPGLSIATSIISTGQLFFFL